MTSRRHLTRTLAALFVALLAPVALATDTDGDGLSDTFESQYGTLTGQADTDSDGWNDYVEIFTHGTDPLMPDTDGDGTNDPSDSDPLLFDTNVVSGSSTVTYASLPGEDWAGSGESPVDGHGVHVHNGGLAYTAGVGQARGVVLPFGFTLKYYSRWDYNGVVGMNWISMLDLDATQQPNSDVVMLTPQGLNVTWAWNGSGWDPPGHGILGELTEPTSGEFLWTQPGGSSLLFVGGRLDTIEDPYGNQVTLTWSGGQATKATDSRGLDHTFAYYSGTGRLKTITMDDGRIWTFEYNDRDQLARIEGPATTQFPSGIVWEFRYTNGSTDPSLNHNMIAAIDGKGQSWLTMTYDEQDRVATQTVGAGTYEFDYSDAANDKTTVTDPAGAERVWEWHATKLTREKLEEKSNLNVRTTDPTSWDTEWTHDADGYLLTVTYPEGNGVKYTLNAAKQPTERRHKEDMSQADSNTNDLVHTWTYDSSKNYGCTGYTDPEGDTETYTLNADGQRTQVSHPVLTGASTAITESWAYNSDGTLDTYTDGEGNVTKYEYFTTPTDKLGRVKKRIVDHGTGSELNLTTEYDYTDWGQVKSVKDPEGNTTTYTVEAYGNVTEIDAPTALGYETLLIYDQNLNVKTRSVKNIDETGTAQTSPTYWTTSYTYSLMDQVIQIEEDISTTEMRVTDIDYDTNLRMTSRRCDGRELELSYDERSKLFERTRILDATPSAIEITESFDYDHNGNLTEYTDPRSKVTEFEYDGFDRRTKTLNAYLDYEVVVYSKCGHVTERKFYDEAGTTDVLMAHSRRSYDEMDRLIEEERALIDTTTTWLTRSYTLDKRGLVTTVEDERGNDTTITWDAARRRTNVTDALGNETDLEYDDNGNLTATDEVEIIPGSTSTETYRTEFEYDALNRRTKQSVIDRTSSTNKKITQWKWNSRGVVAELIDPKGYTTTNTHDGLGRRTKESVDMGSGAAIVTEWEYDDSGNMTLLTDDNGNTTAYEFDTLNRLTKKTYDDASTVTYGYDAAGNVTNMVDRAGNDIDLGYDDLNRLTDRDATLATGFGGDTTEDFTYDALGRLKQAKDDDSIVEFTYDSLSRVLTEKQGPNPFGTSAKTVTYTYDAAGNTTQIDYPSGFEAHRTFDALNRLTLIEDESAVDIADWDLYGAARRRDVVTFGNATTATYTYDGFRRPTDISHETSTPTEFAGFAYGWDKNDNPTYEERSHQSGKGDVYSYDQANRLTKVLQDVDDPANEVANPGTEAYVDKVEYNMDDVLNFTSLVTTPYGGSASTVSYTTNGMNEYTAVGGTTHVYGANGNLTDDGTNEYVYNWKNQLIEVIDGGTQATIATYAYDCYGLGRRFEKVVGTDTTRFVYADQQCLEEYDGSGDLLRLFAFGSGLDEAVMMEAPDVADVDSDTNTTEIKRFYYHTQLIGSVTHITDDDEVVVESYDYGPYGEIAMFDISQSSITASAIGNPLTYTGRRLDEESGLYYYRARHYSAELKRFVQRDPLEYVDGPNAYGYVGARSLTLVDPRGQLSWQWPGPPCGMGDEDQHWFNPDIPMGSQPCRHCERVRETITCSRCGAELRRRNAVCGRCLERERRERERRRGPTEQGGDDQVTDDPPGEHDDDDTGPPDPGPPSDPQKDSIKRMGGILGHGVSNSGPFSQEDIWRWAHGAKYWKGRSREVAETIDTLPEHAKEEFYKEAEKLFD